MSSCATAVAEQNAPERGSDDELIERVAGGDESAFDLLYERYFPRVFRFVDKRLRCRADSEETTQEVFINVFSSLESYRHEAPFAAWVLGIARRTVANRFKKKQHPTVPLEPGDEPDTVDLMMPVVQRTSTPLESYECRERMARIEEAASRHLTREQWILFELHHLRHRSISDIAALMHKSEDSVKSNLYRARKLLLAD
jgi:RNA polymerase sigma-70 factor (ECF subfamily)